MKVTGIELALWEKLLLKHKLLNKPQWDACVAALRTQPALGGLTIGQLLEKQGVKPGHVKQLAEHIRQAIAAAQVQTKPAATAPAAAPTQRPAAPATPAEAKPVTGSGPVIEGISDEDLSIEGLAPVEAAASAPASATAAPTKPATAARATDESAAQEAGGAAAKSPGSKPVDPVLAPKFSGNDDLMPNESDDVRWNPSEAEWIDDIKETTGAKTARSTDIPQIDLGEDQAEDPAKPRPKILKQDDAKEWYNAIGGILSAAGEKKSKEILKLDFDGSIEDPSKTPGEADKPK